MTARGSDVADAPAVDPFAEIAPFYDLDFDEFHDDVSFYERLSEIHGARVLELGCGTGRVAVPLAERGARVTGVDRSAAMLELARQRAGATPIRLVEADLLTLRLRGRFDVATAPLGVFQHLPDADALAEAFTAMARHLAPGGVAVVDFEAPAPEDFDPRPQPVVEHWTKPWEGGSVTKWVSVEPRPSEGLKWVTWHFDVASRRGSLRRITSRFTLLTVTAPEVDLAARCAGLRVVTRYADYDFTPYFDGCERLVVLMQREDDPVSYVYASGRDAEGAFTL